uniref:Putative helicase n=1 Tax=viral metagenome TaxID=1070528 RepID=A0A6M3XYD3_9ZZZZ
MLEENRLSKAEMRELTMLRLLKGGASIEDVIEIIKKLYIADMEDWDEEFVKKEVYGYHELHLSDGKQGKRNFHAEVEDWILSNTSNNRCDGGVTISLHDCYLDLDFKTPPERTACRMVFKRLSEKGKIESVRNRSGLYKVIDGREELIDFINANVAPFDIRLPLGIHEWVTIHRGNVIIIAGESNAGKTAFCLNVAKLNRDSAKVNYMSSEMNDGAELRIRLNEFGGDIEFWKGIKFTFRTDDFPRHIDPDGLNIIDYLDEGTDSEAYKMPMRIRLISDRLKKGVAVIAIQKDPNKGLGFGGSGTLNRARLYITLSRAGILKIEKGKIWRQKTINPNGMYTSFKLAAGCHFKKEGDWKT